MRVSCYRAGGDADPRALKECISSVSHDLIVQTVNESAVTNARLVEMLVEQTIAAAHTDNLLARKKEVDLLLRLAGTTQIATALATVGAKSGEKFVVILVGETDDIRTAESSCLKGMERLEGSELGRAELGRIESAALLNALRG